MRASRAQTVNRMRSVVPGARPPPIAGHRRGHRLRKATTAAVLAGLLQAVPISRALHAAGPDERVGDFRGNSWRVAEAGAPHRAIIPFTVSPFPYAGTVPATGKPFFDIVLEDRSGRTSARTGGVYWADETYSDRRVLLDIPAGFDVSRPGIIVVFFHGNAATLERDVIGRQHVPDQIAAARLNSILIAPQLARDAWDSSSGQFWKRGAFAAFLEEAASRLARLTGDPRAAQAFRAMPIVLVAYSGGYQPLAFALRDPASARRVKGVVLFDALYGEVDAFEGWLAQSRDGFFVSSFAKTTAGRNDQLQRALEHLGRDFRSKLDGPISKGDVYLIPVPENVAHHDFVTKAWTDLPLKDVLARLSGYDR